MIVKHAQSIYRAAVDGVRPERLMGEFNFQTELDRSLEDFDRIVVVGGGKGSLAMGRAAIDRLGPLVSDGILVVPHGYGLAAKQRNRWPDSFEVCEAGHPIPDESGRHASRRILTKLSALNENDLALVLITGGGSALLADYAPGISIDDAQQTTSALLRCGATIHEVNTVRKHLSSISGGRMAVAAAPATVLTLIVSDVIGDDLSVISSGPTVADPSTFEQALEIVRSYQIEDQLPAAVWERLTLGSENPGWETPKPNDPCFAKVHNTLLGNNRLALAAAANEATRLGYDSHIVSSELQGEARDVGKQLAEEALRVEPGRKVCLIWGGETTVTVRGKGMGGRNQELALGAARALDGVERRVVVLSGGTDGIDGPTDAAGGWATPQTLDRGRQLGLDIDKTLADNDAYHYLEPLQNLLKPGPTHTNVMDVQIVLVSDDTVY